MSNVLFLGLPSHGHINPAPGLVSELVRRGERVVYFAPPAFQTDLERAGAEVKHYCDSITSENLPALLREAEHIILDILGQIAGETFEYMVHAADFPFARPLTQILGIPGVSSLAIADCVDRLPAERHPDEAYSILRNHFDEKYGVTLPPTPHELLFNTGVINLAINAEDRIATGQSFAECLNRIQGSCEESVGYAWAVAEIFAAVKERAPQAQRPNKIDGAERRRTKETNTSPPRPLWASTPR